ncbi:MAG: outer membrane beta-barrel protein, partial [Xanthobacteraceae bacterium]
WVICALVVLGFAPRAFAGDFDILRGSQPTYHWGGVYGGVQGGYSSAVVNFGTAAGSEIAFLLRNTAIEQDQQISQWTVLGPRSPTSTSLGGFIGYNVEWEDVILGLELNYNRVSLSASSSDSISRSFSDSTNLPAGHHYFYTVNVGGQSSLQVTDIATFRARAGWEAGNFLPYAFAGLAVGRADISTSATVSYSAFDAPDVQTPPTPQLIPMAPLSFGPVTQTDGQNGALIYGFATGLGMDVGLLPNVFLRGEFEYIYFAPVDGLHLSAASARVGAGIKF